MFSFPVLLMNKMFCRTEAFSENAINLPRQTQAIKKLSNLKSYKEFGINFSKKHISGREKEK